MSCFADGLNTLTDPLNMGKNSLLALVSILGSFWQISLGKLLCNFLFNCFPMYLLYWPDNKLCINYLGCDEVITDRSGQLTTLADTVCTKTFVNEPSKKGPTVYQVSFESFAMRDCATCYVKIKIDGDKTTYCEDNYPTSVMQITQDTFELEGLIMDNGGFHLPDLIIMELKSHMTC